MKIEYLNYILEVWRCGSINAAAKVLYLSQSGLSSIIKSVEGELGYPIFERGAKWHCGFASRRSLFPLCRAYGVGL